MEKIAQRAINEPEKAEAMEVIFCSAPLFLLNRREIHHPTDIASNLTIFKADTIRLSTQVPIAAQEPMTPLQRVKVLIEKNNISKALRLLNDNPPFVKSSGLIAKLKRKVIDNPEISIDAVRELPEKSKTRQVITIDVIVRKIRSLKNGVTPGTGMLAAEHLKPLTHFACPCALALISKLIHQVSNGEVADHLRPLLYGDVMKGSRHG